jgi:hypothetical protein
MCIPLPIFFRGSSAKGCIRNWLQSRELEALDLADQPLNNRSKGRVSFNLLSFSPPSSPHAGSRTPNNLEPCCLSLSYPLYKTISVRLSEAFKLRPFSCPASLAEIPSLGFSLPAQRRLVSARIGICSTRFALRPPASITCEFLSKMKCWGTKRPSALL